MDAQIPRPGELLAGRFVVERVLGSGGMGVVLAARHTELGELVAVKMLRLPAGDQRAVQRLRREARAAAKLRGEHVVRVMDVGMLESGAPFIVMEYVAGQTVAQAREAVGRLPVNTAVDWVLQACEGLAEAHGLGIVHRDIKPSNLLLTTRPDGSRLIKLLDFGIAKSVSVAPVTLTETGGFLGSPLYASPEQVRDARALDHRTDIWSMGVVLYQLVTGQLPFPSYTATAALASLVADPPTLPRSVVPELPAELERVLLRCLEKDPRARFANVAELARALEPFGSAEAAGATERVARILSRAGKDFSAPQPAQETLSTLGGSQDGSLAASRTASQVLPQVAGKPRRSPRLRVGWLLSALALLLAGAGLWARAARSSAALAENPADASLSSAAPSRLSSAAGSGASAASGPAAGELAVPQTSVARASRAVEPPTSASSERNTALPSRSVGERLPGAARFQAPAPALPTAQVAAAPVTVPAAPSVAAKAVAAQADDDDFGPRK
jgi:eukaryotic-like serine/threonine-protein kinase